MLVVGLALLLASAAASSVIDLGKRNFATVTRGSAPVFVKFYVPGCNKCQELAPIFARLADDSRNSGVLFAQVNGHDYDELVPAEVKHYPALYLYRGRSKPRAYTGPRQPNLLQAFLNESLSRSKLCLLPFDDYSLQVEEDGDKARIPAKIDIRAEGVSGQPLDLTSESLALLEQESSQRTLLVLFYSPSCSHCTRFKPTWSSLAKQYNVAGSAVLLASFNGQISRQTVLSYGVSQYPTVIAFRGGKRATYSGNRSASDLENFISQQAPSLSPQ